MSIERRDKAIACELEPSVLAEFLYADGGLAWLPDDTWYTRGAGAVPESADAIAGRDNGDNYSVPGGDRLFRLM